MDWILARDSNHNGLVEMMNDNSGQKCSSDWIDIIWASYENAFVNAKLYHALVKWADIEQQLNNTAKAKYYAGFAAKLKNSFNRSIKEGGFWDDESGCYVHWRDKDGTIHGNNMVTPVNFMAIAYGICDDSQRKKRILDSIEARMEKEKLFFWPIAMNTYAPGEGNGWQFPFPAYENGDLFLSWGSIGVAAYAAYNPALALKYVKNVLEQYSKDGLAFQRYGRLKQEGLGDDILSGNSLSIVGLYQAIYGINPLYNRFYLDPHITADLAGTTLRYNYRGKNLSINLDSGSYTVADGKYKLTAPASFGFNTGNDELSYFNGNSPEACLQVSAKAGLSLTIQQWLPAKMEWVQHSETLVHQLLNYQLAGLKANTAYAIVINGKPFKSLQSDANGHLTLNYNAWAAPEQISVTEAD